MQMEYINHRKQNHAGLNVCLLLSGNKNAPQIARLFILSVLEQKWDTNTHKYLGFFSQ